MSSDKSGSPPCGIYVRIDNFSDMRAIITGLRQMAMVINRASGYEKNMHAVELVSDSDDESVVERVTDLIQIVQAQGLVAIVGGKVKNFDIMGADGLLLESVDEYHLAREVLGEDTIIGLSCASSRENAEKALLLDMDYIVLSADPKFLNWWSAKTEILCAATSSMITNIACGDLARAGANFVDVSAYIFQHQKGVMQGTSNILHELELAAQTPKVLN